MEQPRLGRRRKRKRRHAARLNGAEMKLNEFTVKLKNADGGEYNMKVIAADEFSAAHVVEYSLLDGARAETEIVDVIAGEG